MQEAKKKFLLITENYLTLKQAKKEFTENCLLATLEIVSTKLDCLREEFGKIPTTYWKRLLWALQGGKS
jgi:hypothetical protein